MSCHTILEFLPLGLYHPISCHKLPYHEKPLEPRHIPPCYTIPYHGELVGQLTHHANENYLSTCHAFWNIPHHAIPCQSMPYHAMPIYLAIQWRASWAHIMPYQTRLELLSLGLYHPIPFHTMLYHLILCHTMENHLGTCHAMPCLSQRPPPSPSVCSLHCISSMWLIVPESYDCYRVLVYLNPYPIQLLEKQL